MKRFLVMLSAAAVGVSSLYAAAAKEEVKAPVKKHVAAKKEEAAPVAKAGGKKECVRFGVKIGGDLATLSLSGMGGSPPTLKMKIGWTEGVMAEIPMGKALALQAEAAYVQKGAGMDTGSSTVKAKFEGDFVEFQSLLKIKLGEPGAPARLFFIAGPQFSVKTQLRQVMWDSTGGEWSNPPSGQVKSTDAGVVGGIGVDLKKVTLDVRYDLGLLNLSNDSGGGSFKTRALLVDAGYFFN